MKTRYVYHYCAKSFEDGGNVKYIDGVATYDGPIQSYDAYRILQNDISNTHNLKNITITSLSPLGEKEE